MNTKQKQDMQRQVAELIASKDHHRQLAFLRAHAHELLWQQYLDWLLNYAQLHRYSIDEEHWLVGTVEKPYPRIKGGGPAEVQALADAFYAITCQSSEYDLYPADLGDINGVLLGEFLQNIDFNHIFGSVSEYTVVHYTDFERIF